MTTKIAEIRKALVAIAALIAQLLALGLLADPVDKYASAALALLTALGVWAVPNALPAGYVPTHAAGDTTP
jgi:hypothetical protein